MNYMNRSTLLVHRGVRSALGFCVTLAIGVVLAADPTFDRQLAESIPHHDAPPPAAPSRWDFNFGDGRALMRKDGTWQIETEIKHGGLGCGNYRLGVRFGAGNPGCLDVAWLGEPMFAIHLKHCNNAMRPHHGDGYDALLMDAFDQITCAERLIRCTGTCSMRQEGFVEPMPGFGGT